MATVGITGRHRRIARSLDLWTQVCDPRTEDPREFWGESGQIDPLDRRGRQAS